MPPIPVTFDDTTTSAIESLQRRQRDLSDFQIPRLRKCTGPLALQQRLAVELREDLDTFARQVEALQVSVDDQSGELNRRELGRVVDEFKGTLGSLRKDTRTALLTSKRTIDAQSVSNRDELLRSGGQSEKQGENSQGDDALMGANNDVTTALRRTLDIMQGELEKSVLSSQLLDESSATLHSASAQHDTLSLVMNTSKQLITVLEKSDWLDRMLLMAGLFFFVLVVLFILKQRIVDRGLRVAFWWTRFLPSMSTSHTVAQKAGEIVVEKAERGEVTAVDVTSTLTVAVTTAAASALSSTLNSLSSLPTQTEIAHAEPSLDITSSLNNSLLLSNSSSLHDEL